MCPTADELSPEAEYFAAVKSCVGQHLAALESPDDLVGFFGSLAEGVITSCTSAAGDGEERGTDASSAMGVYLRMVYARYTAMPYEVGAARADEGAFRSRPAAARRSAANWSAAASKAHRPARLQPLCPRCRPSASCCSRCKPTLMQRWRCCRASRSRRRGRPRSRPPPTSSASSTPSWAGWGSAPAARRRASWSGRWQSWRRRRRTCPRSSWPATSRAFGGGGWLVVGGKAGMPAHRTGLQRPPLLAPPCLTYAAARCTTATLPLPSTTCTASPTTPRRRGWAGRSRAPGPAQRTRRRRRRASRAACRAPRSAWGPCTRGLGMWRSRCRR